MTRFNVDSAQVADASARAAASGETIRTEVATMVSQLTALEGSWQGGAATAFAGVLDQWHAAQAQVEQALDALSTALAHAATTYEDAEQQATRMFG
ncbi:WXG100 family type VII secretion target [Demequina sp. NBRC 110057]|uniref:WXG100 family type VII secretion target n=1 Tax=Demequina sp. NBRC 110057 TaxID=1570346 RepID=UPI000A00A10E|nr:WXG100 family type VII secretion target [Demequina sp. NBRC 110057]